MLKRTRNICNITYSNMIMTTTSTGGEVNLGLERKDGEGEGHSSSDSNLERKP